MSSYTMSPEFSRLIANVLSDNFKPKNQEEKDLKKYIRLVIVIAKKYVRQNVPYEDLISCGIMGLLEATRNFDPERSTNFKAYAITRVKGRIYEYCVSNTSNITIPTHVGKSRVYVERMTKILDKEPQFFNRSLPTKEIISVWEHPMEEELQDKTQEQIRKIKTMVSKIAKNSKTTYEGLVKLAYKSIVTEITDEEIRDCLSYEPGSKIEQDVTVREITETLSKKMGAKKTRVLVLHHQGYNNEDIAKKIFEENLTERRISRQAIRGLLKSAEKKAKKHVRKS